MVEMPRSRQLWSLIIRFIIMVVLLGWVGTHLDWHELATQLSRANGVFVTLAIALMSLVFVLVTLRWWLLLRVQEIHLPFKTVGALVMIGQFFNAFLPGATGGDAVKIFYILKYAPNRKARGTLTIILDRILGLLGLLGLTLLLIPTQWTRLQENEETRLVGWLVLLTLMAGFSGLLFFMFMPWGRLPEKVKRLWQRVPGRSLASTLHDAMQLYRKQWPVSTGAYALSLLVHVINLACGYWIACALGMVVHFGVMMVVLGIGLTISSVPLTPGGLGVREGSFVILFQIFGLTATDGAGKELAVACSFLFYFCGLFWSGVGAVIYLFFKHHHEECTRTEMVK